MEQVIKIARSMSLDTARDITQGRGGEFVPAVTAGAIISYEIELVELKRQIMELGKHLTALCNHPNNFEHRYETREGYPCPGCYDARDAFETWKMSEVL